MINLTPGPTLLQKLRAYLFMRKWRKTATDRALAKHTQKFFYTESKLRFFEEANKTKFINAFYEKVFSLPTFANPFLKFREELANAVVGFADLQVLCLTQEEKAQSPWSGAKYISGELHRYIRACCPHQEEMKRILWEHPDLTDEELVEAANTRSALWLYLANGFNMVRAEFNETIVKGHDWYRPFVASAMIFAENTYRSKIGLPSLIRPENCPLELEHSTFMGFVVEGVPNPLYSWEDHYKKVHSENI
jgi:hypothetical protein